MRYRLIVLTHGENDCLLDAVQSFHEHVTPHPVDAYLHRDGDASRWNEVTSPWPWFHGHDLPARGFCHATRQAWQFAQSPGDHDYVFWLEHDFVFTRDVNLAEMAHVLDGDRMLAQMALMRNAVNDVERSAGGLFESRQGEYVERHHEIDTLRDDSPWTDYRSWLEHRSYFTTNPSLMRRDFMQANPFPSIEKECEGLYGLGLVEQGYHFGVWGNGEPWVRHIGARTGFGY